MIALDSLNVSVVASVHLNPVVNEADALSLDIPSKDASSSSLTVILMLCSADNDVECVVPVVSW